MRKIIAFAAVIALFGATSCKKDYTCTCTTKTTGMADVTTSHTLAKMKKNDAETACKQLESNTSAGGVSVTTTCTL